MADATSDFTTRLPEKLKGMGDSAKSAVNAIFVFKITGDGGGTWTLDAKNNVGIREGAEDGADCTIEISSDDWKTISENPGAATQLFFTGKLKVSGNPMLATKLQKIL
jgi:putative sterol carrier protein